MVKVGDRKYHELNIKATEVKRKFPTKLQNKQCVWGTNVPERILKPEITCIVGSNQRYPQGEHLMNLLNHALIKI